MSFEKEVQKLNIEELADIADNYYSGSDYARYITKQAKPSGRAISAINNRLKEYDLEWKERGNKSKVIVKICPVCKKEFNTIKYATKNKNEKTTCSYSCSNTYFRSGTNNGRYQFGHGTNYRNIAFNELPNMCNRCSILDKEVLIVHHIDRNRNNNDISNLEILCANCHMKEHKTPNSSV